MGAGLCTFVAAAFRCIAGRMSTSRDFTLLADGFSSLLIASGQPAFIPARPITQGDFPTFKESGTRGEDGRIARVRYVLPWHKQAKTSSARAADESPRGREQMASSSCRRLSS